MRFTAAHGEDSIITRRRQKVSSQNALQGPFIVFARKSTTLRAHPHTLQMLSDHHVPRTHRFQQFGTACLLRILRIVGKHGLWRAGWLSPRQGSQQKKEYPHAVDLTIDPSAPF